MADNDDTEAPDSARAEDLTDELVRKYDPERLLRMVAKRAGKGEALDHSVRHRYEKRFGVDLGHVRIFSGEFAEEFNKKRNAYAATIGSTGIIMMGGSADKGHGAAAESLLAHELTHVAQAQRHQGGGLHRKAAGGETMPFTEEHEEEAEEHEHDVQHGAGGDHAPPHSEAEAKNQADDKKKEKIEKIKERVMQMAADAARTFQYRNGPPMRRP